MAAVLVHIDLDGDHPDPSSLAALAAGRAAASSWGATLYAAVIIHDPAAGRPADDTGRISKGHLPELDTVRAALARAGADKVVVAHSDAPVAPLWAAVGGAWQGVLDHLRPRLVLFGAAAPTTAELGPRTAARIGARLLVHARATGIDHVDLRDRDGGTARAADGGAAVALIGAMAASGGGDDDIDVVVLDLPGGADPRIEIAAEQPAELAHATGAVVAIGDDVAGDRALVAHAQRLAALLGARVVGTAGAVRAGAVPAAAAVDRATALAPALCVAIGAGKLDLAGATHVIRIGGADKHADVVVPGPAGPALAELVRALEAE